MAKESMKAREVKRAKLVAKYAANALNSKPKAIMRLCNHFPKTLRPCVCTIVAALPVVPKDISANLAFLVSNSVKWHRQDLSPA